MMLPRIFTLGCGLIIVTVLVGWPIAAVSNEYFTRTALAAQTDEPTETQAREHVGDTAIRVCGNHGDMKLPELNSYPEGSICDVPKNPVVVPVSGGGNKNEGAIHVSPGLSFVNNVTLGYHHVVRDFFIRQGSGSCSSCGGGIASGAMMPQLSITRSYRSRNMTEIASSFSPGMFCSPNDIHLTFSADEEGGGPQEILVFDPRDTFTPHLLTPDPADAFSFVDQVRESIMHLKMYDSGGVLTSSFGDAVELILTTHSGDQYYFEKFVLVEAGVGGQFTTEYVGRLTRIEDRNDRSLDLAYKTWTAAEIAASPERQLQVDSITDAYGRTATFTYLAQQVSGLWVISQIDLPNNQKLVYEYTNGKLSKVKYDDGTEATITYGTDAVAQTSTITFADVGADGGHRNKTVHLTNSGFFGDDGTVFNQASNLARMVVNGCGEVSYMNWMAVDPSSQEEVVDHYVYEGSGRLQKQTVPEYRAYFQGGWHLDTATNDVTGTLESTYAQRLGANPTTKKGDPAKLQDDQGRTYSYEYDSDTFVTKKTYDADSTFEEWSYNSFKQVTRYRDRLGRVTKYTYDTRGNMLTMEVGILEVAGNDVNQPEHATYTWEYYAAGHQNEFLLKTAFDPLYDAAKPDLHRTDYEYNADHFLVKKIEAADVASGTRPEWVYTYDTAGRLKTSKDPEGRETEYTYDERDRVVETEYHDGSTEQTLFGDTASGHENLIVKTKDRNDVITTYDYDDCDRLTEKVVAAAIDANILDGQADDTLITTPSQKSKTTYVYMAGTRLPLSVTHLGEKTSYTYDFRHRVIETKVKPRVNKELIAKNVYENNELFSSEDYYGRKTYHLYRDSDGLLIRTVHGTVPSFSLADDTAVENKTRDSANNATYIITDRIYNAAGDLIEQVDGRNLSTTYDYDSRVRRIRMKAAAGTNIEAKTETDYDVANNVTEVRTPRYFDSNDTEGHQEAKTTSTYNGRNLLASRTEAPGTASVATTSYTYYLDGRAKTATDARNNDWTQFWHTCCGRLLGNKDPAGHGRFANTDFRGDVTHTAVVEDYASHTNSHNPLDAKTLNETTILNDARRRVEAQTAWLVARGLVDANDVPIAGLDGVAQADGLTTRYLYDDDLTDDVGLDSTTGLSVSKLAGGSFHVSIDDVLTKLAETPANGGAGVSFGADCDGSAVVTINPEEELAVAIYDGLGRIVCRAIIEPHDGSDPNGLMTWSTMLHDTVVNVSGFGDCVETQSINAVGDIAKSRSDGIGRTIESVDEEGNVSTAEYDANGNLKKGRDANSVGVDVVYDELDRPTSQTDTENDQTSTAYNLAGHVISTTDAKNNTETCVFDVRGRRTSCTDRINGVTQWTYDKNNNLLSVEDAENRTTSYEYDSRNLKTKTTYPDHVNGSAVGTTGYGICEYTYDPAGRLDVKTDQLGDTVTFNYDLTDRLTARDYRAQGSSTIVDSDTFTYDDASRRLTAVSGRYTNTCTFTYDDAGRVASEALTIDGQTYTVSKEYDDVSREKKCTYPDGSVVERTYTQRSQLHELKYQGSVIDTRTYDAGMRLSQCSYGNGVDTDFSYHDDNLVSQIDTTHPASVHTSRRVGTYDYTYDANKNKTAETITGQLSGYGFSTGATGYDDEDRLTTWNRTDTNKNQSWNLSLVGDWNSFTENTTVQNRTHNSVHEVTAVGGTAIQYDVKGNVTQNQNAHGLTWDFDNQMATVDLNGSGSPNIRFRYSALGQRVRKHVNADIMVYVYDGQRVIAEYDSGAAPSSPNEQYVYGSYIDEPVLKDGTGGKLYYHRNSQYSVVGLSDSTGTLVERYAYTAYGELLILSGSAGSVRGTSSYKNPYLYTGRRWDRRPNLYYFRARYYDPSLGRFTSRDQLGYVDGMSTYAGYFAMHGTLDPFGNAESKTITADLMDTDPWYKLFWAHDDFVAGVQLTIIYSQVGCEVHVATNSGSGSPDGLSLAESVISLEGREVYCVECTKCKYNSVYGKCPSQDNTNTSGQVGDTVWSKGHCQIVFVEVMYGGPDRQVTEEWTVTGRIAGGSSSTLGTEIDKDGLGKLTAEQKRQLEGQAGVTYKWGTKFVNPGGHVRLGAVAEICPGKNKKPTFRWISRPGSSANSTGRFVLINGYDLWFKNINY